MRTGLFLSSVVPQGCGKCHSCYCKLNERNWCSHCSAMRLYSCHGWIGDSHDSTPCPTKEGIVEKYLEQVGRKDDWMGAMAHLVASLNEKQAIISGLRRELAAKG